MQGVSGTLTNYAIVKVCFRYVIYEAGNSFGCKERAANFPAALRRSSPALVLCPRYRAYALLRRVCVARTRICRSSPRVMLPNSPARTARRSIARSRTGKLSATKNELGRYLIDPAELERVYGTLRPGRVMPTRVLIDAMRRTRSVLRRCASSSCVREMLNRSATSAERCAMTTNATGAPGRKSAPSLRGMLEKHTEQIKLLTDQRERAEQERQATAARPRPLLARMFGRR